MWKCKECGGTEIHTTVMFTNAELDISGEIINHPLNQYEVENYCCSECFCEDSNIEDLATWVENKA